jgi:antirestriction protein ArdC
VSRSTATVRADPADRLAAAHTQLVSAVEALAGGDQWRRMLTVAARFPTYSANNVLLIGLQRPDATRVARIRTWNALGRRVRKGEKGIAILAPCLSRPRREDAASQGPTHQPRTSETPSERERREPPRELRGFRVVHVFDLEQTVGEPLPEIEPQLLTGDAPRLLTTRLTETIHADGYAVERGPCQGANGYTDLTTRTVRVREDVPDAQAAKTLAHELGHMRADHEHRFLANYRSSLGCRAQAEVEAESIAYLVTSMAGLPTEAYSVPYLAGWSGGDTTLLRDAAARTIGVARGIVTDLRLDRQIVDLEPPLPEHDRVPGAAQPRPAEREGPRPC